MLYKLHQLQKILGQGSYDIFQKTKKYFQITNVQMIEWEFIANGMI